MGDAVSLSVSGSSALFRLGAPVQCNSAILSCVRRDECRATFCPPHGSLFLCTLHSRGSLPVCHPRILGGAAAEDFAGR